MENNHCEKCRIYHQMSVEVSCGNDTCPCHNLIQETPKVMQEPSWELSDTQPELEHQGWEKEFDKEFCQNGQEVATYSKMSMSGIAITNEVKSFIRSLLASEKEKGYQQGIKEAPESIGQYDEGYEEGAKSQKQEIIEKIEVNSPKKKYTLTVAFKNQLELGIKINEIIDLLNKLKKD